MQALSARLEAIVQSLRPCRLLADVGADHGLLPIAAVLRGVATNAIASDLREAPLRLAQRNIELAQLESRVTPARGDGLAELADRGVAVVPTRYLPVGTTAAERDLPDDGGHGFVVKPAESVGALGLSRWPADATGRAGAVAAVDALHADGQDVLVQPLLPAVTDRGEFSLVLVDGQLSHTVRKVPTAGDIRSQPEWGAALSRVRATAAQEALAQAALDAALDILGVDGALLYARVDCVDHEGEPSLMELELIEPDLYVGFDDGAADRVVAALAARLGR